MKTPVVKSSSNILILALMLYPRFVFRRAILVRGQGGDSGYGSNNGVIEALLDRAKVGGWTRAGTITLSGKQRSDDREISSEVSRLGAELLHITNQYDAHMVPRSSPGIPVVVSVHDLYDLRPRTIDAGDVPVPLGDRFPTSSKSRLISACREGMARADLLMCSSSRTLDEARTMFPGTQCELVRDSVDGDFWNPVSNPRSRSLLGESGDEGKCLLVSVGERDPRWRAQFVDEVLSMLPEDVREDIHLIRIGSGRIDWERVSAAFQHAEAMIYPGVSVGFRSPPLEAIASGCPVLASDLPMHDEVLPARCLVPAIEADQWVSAIVKIHADWERSGGVPRLIDEELLEISQKYFGRDAHGTAIAMAYESASQR